MLASCSAAARRSRAPAYDPAPEPEPLAAAAPEDDEPAYEAVEAEPPAARPRHDLATTDPKVVIESGTPAVASEERDTAEQEVSTLEPPRGDKSEDDQPKRRGWWNRII